MESSTQPIEDDNNGNEKVSSCDNQSITKENDVQEEKKSDKYENTSNQDSAIAIEPQVTEMPSLNMRNDEKLNSTKEIYLIDKLEIEVKEEKEQTNSVESFNKMSEENVEINNKLENINNKSNKVEDCSEPQAAQMEELSDKVSTKIEDIEHKNKKNVTDQEVICQETIVQDSNIEFSGKIINDNNSSELETNKIETISSDNSQKLKDDMETSIVSSSSNSTTSEIEKKSIDIEKNNEFIIEKTIQDKEKDIIPTYPITNRAIVASTIRHIFEQKSKEIKLPQPNMTLSKSTSYSINNTISTNNTQQINSEAKSISYQLPDNKIFSKDTQENEKIVKNNSEKQINNYTQQYNLDKSQSFAYLRSSPQRQQQQQINSYNNLHSTTTGYLHPNESYQKSYDSHYNRHHHQTQQQQHQEMIKNPDNIYYDHKIQQKHQSLIGNNLSQLHVKPPDFTKLNSTKTKQNEVPKCNPPAITHQNFAELSKKYNYISDLQLKNPPQVSNDLTTSKHNEKTSHNNLYVKTPDFNAEKFEYKNVSSTKKLSNATKRESAIVELTNTCKTNTDNIYARKYPQLSHDIVMSVVPTSKVSSSISAKNGTKIASSNTANSSSSSISNISSSNSANGYYSLQSRKPESSPNYSSSNPFIQQNAVHLQRRDYSPHAQQNQPQQQSQNDCQNLYGAANNYTNYNYQTSSVIQNPTRSTKNDLKDIRQQQQTNSTFYQQPQNYPLTIQNNNASPLPILANKIQSTNSIYKSTPSPGVMNPPYSWPSQTNRLSSQSPVAVVTQQIQQQQQQVQQPQQHHYRISQSPVAHHSPSPHSPSYFHHHNQQQPHHASPKPSPSPTFTSRSAVTPVSNNNNNNINYKNPYFHHTQNPFVYQNIEQQTDNRNLISNYYLKSDKDNSLRSKDILYNTTQRSSSDCNIYSNKNSQSKNEDIIQTNLNSRRNDLNKIQTNKLQSNIVPVKYPSEINLNKSNDKPNYREMINHAYAVRHATSEDDLNYQIIKRTLNKDISIRRSENDLSKNIFDTPTPTKNLLQQYPRNCETVYDPYNSNYNYTNSRFPENHETKINKKHNSINTNKIKDTKLVNQRQPIVPFYNDLTKNDISVTVSKVNKINNEITSYMPEKVSKTVRHRLQQHEQDQQQKPQQRHYQNTVTPILNLRNESVIENSMKKTNINNLLNATIKRESPLDLSVKTVKTKADSTGCDDSTTNSNFNNINSCNSNSNLLRSNLSLGITQNTHAHKVDFSPNFSKHTGIEYTTNKTRGNISNDLNIRQVHQQQQQRKTQQQYSEAVPQNIIRSPRQPNLIQQQQQQQQQQHQILQDNKTFSQSSAPIEYRKQQDQCLYRNDSPSYLRQYSSKNDNIEQQFDNNPLYNTTQRINYSHEIEKHTNNNNNNAIQTNYSTTDYYNSQNELNRNIRQKTQIDLNNKQHIPLNSTVSNTIPVIPKHSNDLIKHSIDPKQYPNNSHNKKLSENCTIPRCSNEFLPEVVKYRQTFPYDHQTSNSYDVTNNFPNIQNNYSSTNNYNSNSTETREPNNDYSKTVINKMNTDFIYRESQQYNRKRCGDLTNNSSGQYQPPDKQVRVDELYREHLAQNYTRQNYSLNNRQPQFNNNNIKSEYFPKKEIQQNNFPSNTTIYTPTNRHYQQIINNNNNINNSNSGNGGSRSNYEQNLHPIGMNETQTIQHLNTNKPNFGNNIEYVRNTSTIGGGGSNDSFIIAEETHKSMISINNNNNLRGADQNVISKLRNSIELREFEKQKTLNRKNNKIDKNYDEEIVKPDIASIIAARIRTKGELKGYTPIPPVNPKNEFESEKKNGTPEDSQPELLPESERSTPFDLMDWGSACNDFLEQLQTGTNKKRIRKRRSHKSSIDGNDENSSALNSLPGVEYKDDIDKELIEQIKSEVIEKRNKELNNTQNLVQESSSDEDKPLLFLRQQSLSEITRDNSEIEQKEIFTPDKDTKIQDSESAESKQLINQNLSPNHFSDKSLRNIKEKRLELEKRLAARLSRTSSSESEDETKRNFQRPKKFTRRLGSRTSNNTSNRELSQTESSSSSNEAISRALIRSRIDQRKRKLKTSIESDGAQVDSNETTLKPKIITKAKVKCMKSIRDKSESSEGEQEQLNFSTRQTPKSVRTKRNLNNIKPQEVSKIEETMTRSKRKKRLQEEIANSKILRNDKIITNTVIEKKSKVCEKTPGKITRISDSKSSEDKSKTNNSPGKNGKFSDKQEYVKRKLVISNDGKDQSKRKKLHEDEHSSSDNSNSMESENETVSDRVRTRRSRLSYEQTVISESPQKTPTKNLKMKTNEKNGTEHECKKLNSRSTKKLSLKQQKIIEQENLKEKFPPGWEREVYQYKRSLKVPLSLITIKGPAHHRVSTSLPDLDPHSSDASETGINNINKINHKNNIEKEQSQGTQVSNKIKIEEIKNEPKITSIIDVLHQRVIRPKKVSKKVLKISNEPKLLPRGSNEAELLPTPSVKDEKDSNNKHFSMFETEVLKTRTRTEYRALKTKELIREVFGGEDRPASAPPEICDYEANIKSEQLTFDEKYEQYLQKMNIDFGEKIRKIKKPINNDENCNFTEIQIKKEVLDDEIGSIQIDGDETQDIEINVSVKEEFDRDTPSIISERDGVITPLIFKRKKNGRNSRRKGSSGFDYIRKKKKPTNNINTNGQNDLNRVRKRLPLNEFQHSRNENDVSREIQKWVLNKGLGQSVLHKAARLGYVDVIAYCLEREGMNPDMKDNACYTPLHEACSKGRIDIARILLQYGCNHSETAASGIRPLHEAIESGDIEFVRLLLAYGADPCLTTYAGQTPLMLAENHEMEQFLKSHLHDIQNTGPHKQPWKFPGPWFICDPDTCGFNVLADAPESGKEDDEDIENIKDNICEKNIEKKIDISQKHINEQKCDTNSNIMPYQDNFKSIAHYETISSGLKTKFKNISSKCAVVLNNISSNNKKAKENRGKFILRRRPTTDLRETKTKQKIKDSNYDGDFFEFEECDTPLPPLYLLKDEGNEKWVLLNDLCTILKVKSKDTLLKQICPSTPPNVNKELLRELKMSEFLERATCLQLLCAGEKLNIRSSKVILVKYNDSVRNLLGVKTVFMRF